MSQQTLFSNGHHKNPYSNFAFQIAYTLGSYHTSIVQSFYLFHREIEL